MKYLLILTVFSTLCLGAYESSGEHYQKTWPIENLNDLKKNHKAVFVGTLRKYTPIERGKGEGTIFWDWEIVLKDGYTLPVIGKGIAFEKFENRRVKLNCFSFYGTIVGEVPETIDPYSCPTQRLTGYRLDVASIELLD